MFFELRVISGGAKIEGAATRRGGASPTYHAGGNSRGASRSPMPSAKAFPPKRKNGTSAPSVSAIAASFSFGRARPHRRVRNARVGAPSGPAPAQPPPTAVFFFIPLSPP